MKALALPLAAAITATAHGAQKQPNIILFMVDDMGWQDTSEIGRASCRERV